MDYGGLIRAHINHTSTYTEKIGGIIEYGGIKGFGLGWRARLMVFGILDELLPVHLRSAYSTVSGTDREHM